METCTNLLEYNENLRKKVISQWNNFATTPAARTADVVSSIQVLTAQLVALNKLPPEKRQVTEDPQEPDLYRLTEDYAPLARFGAEEILRRLIKKDQPGITASKVLNLLFPDW